MLRKTYILKLKVHEYWNITSLYKYIYYIKFILMKNKIYQVKKSVLLPDTPYIDQTRPRILLLTKLDLIPRGEFLSPCIIADGDRHVRQWVTHWPHSGTTDRRWPLIKNRHRPIYATFCTNRQYCPKFLNNMYLYWIKGERKFFIIFFSFLFLT